MSTNNIPANIDVAISLSSEDVEMAESISSLLKRRGLKVYFYEHSPGQNLGVDLRLSLKKIYSSATCVLVLCSDHYEGDLTSLELESAVAGAAGEKGIVPIVIDGEASIPKSLESLAFWPKQKSLIELANTIAERFGVRSLSTPILLFCALSLVGAFALWSIVFLGFNSLTRKPDVYFIACALLPGLWVVIYRLFPLFLRKVTNIRERSWTSTLGVIERRMDYLGYLFGWMTFLVLTVSVAYGYQVSKALNEQSHLLENQRRNLSISYDEFYGLFTAITVLADRLSLESQPNLLQQYQTQLLAYEEKFKESGEKLRQMSESVNLNSNTDSLEVFLRSLVTLERTLERNIAYQVRELIRPAESFDSIDSFTNHNRIKREMLINYNQFFIDTMMESQNSFRQVQLEFENKTSKFRMFWSGVIENKVGAHDL